MPIKRFVFVSDSHSQHEALSIPDGDALLHCGDLTNMGTVPEVSAFDDWLGALPHEHKVVIAGNHDWLFEKSNAEARALITNAHYLQDSGMSLWGKKIWGSPWQPEFFNWAFNLPPGEQLQAKWDLIPQDTDILLTHGPPWGILDQNWKGRPCGCRNLTQTVQRIRPQVHAFGHIHEGYGTHEQDGIRYLNASVCTADYQATNPPIVIDLEV